MAEGGRASGQGRAVRHPLLQRAGSTGDVSTVGFQVFDPVDIIIKQVPWLTDVFTIVGVDIKYSNLWI